MEIKVSKMDLTEAIKKVTKAISGKAIIPILSGLHLVAKNNRLILTGSDSELSIRTFLNVNEDEVDSIEILQEGSIVLPAKKFERIIRSMPNKMITIKSKEDNKNQIEIISGKSCFTLNGMAGDEYPKMPNIDGKGFSIKGMELKSLIERTIYAVSKSESKPILNGVKLFFENGQLGMVATDAYRLARVVGDIFQNETEETITIPGNTLKEIPSLLSDSDEVLIKIASNQVVFKTENVYILSRLLEGKYPETDRLIPTDYKTLLTVDRKSFLGAIERSAILAENDHPVVKLTITKENSGIFKSVELSHTSLELGESKEQIIVDEIEGEELTISFNPNYMIDALKRIEEEKIIIEFNGAMRPFILKPFDKSNLIHLILPMRTY